MLLLKGIELQSGAAGSEVFSLILYFYFKIFFKRYQCFKENDFTLLDNVTIIQVYVMDTSFNYFNLFLR